MIVADTAPRDDDEDGYDDYDEYVWNNEIPYVETYTDNDIQACSVFFLSRDSAHYY